MLKRVHSPYVRMIVWTLVVLALIPASAVVGILGGRLLRALVNDDPGPVRRDTAIGAQPFPAVTPVGSPAATVTPATTPGHHHARQEAKPRAKLRTVAPAATVVPIVPVVTAAPVVTASPVVTAAPTTTRAPVAPRPTTRPAPTASPIVFDDSG